MGPRGCSDVQERASSTFRPDIQDSHRTAWKQHALALLVFLVGYYVLTFPSLHYLTTELFCDSGDGLQNFWNNWWVRHSVAQWKSPWHTDHLYHPEGVTLLGATLNPFNGFMTIPLCWVFSPLTAYNLMVVFAFVVGGYTAFLLARELGCGYWPSVLCGAVFTFSPYHFGHAHGHMQLISLQWLPLFFYAFIRLLRQPTPGRGVLAGVTLLLNLLCDHYYFLFCILSGAVLFVHRAWTLRQPLFFTRKRQLGPMVVFVVTALALCGPLAGGFLYSHRHDPFLGAHEEDLWVNDLFAPLIHSQVWRFAPLTEFFWSQHPAHKNLSEFGSHLGLSILLVSAYGVIDSRRRGEGSRTWIWLILGLLFYLFSLGPVLLVMGERYAAVPMPFTGLKILLPILSLGGTPVRMAVIYYLAAGVLTAFGAGYAWRGLRARKTVLTVFLVLFCIEYWPREIPRYQIRLPAVTQALSELPPGAVLGLDPVATETLLYQTAFEKPIAGGYIARLPSSRQERFVRYTVTRKQGDYESMMREFEGTYLVRTIRQMPRVTGPDFKCIYRNDTHEIHVWRTNPAMRTRPEVPAGPELCDARMELELSPEVESSKIRFELQSPGDGGRPFALVFSGGQGMGLRISKTRRLPLADDHVFRASLDQSNPLFDNWGTLDESGRGIVTIHPPKDPSAASGEITLWVSLVVFHTENPQQVCRFSEPQRITLRW